MVKVLSILFLAFSISIAQSSAFLITGFKKGLTIPAAENSIVAPLNERDPALMPVSEAVLSPGQILLRKKNGVNDYNLFIGRLKPDAIEKLSIFQIPSGMGVSDAAYTRFYVSAEAGQKNPDSDIGEIYFDGSFIYALNRNILSFNLNNKFAAIKSLAEPPAILRVVTQPSGARTFIDGVYKGKTPYDAGVIAQQGVAIRVELEGYYIQEDFVELPCGRNVIRQWNLAKKMTFNDGSVISAEAFTAENTESVEELGERINRLKARIAEQKATNEKALRTFEANYPKLPERGEFELKPDFALREVAYKNEKSDQKKLIEDQGLQVVMVLENAVKKIDEYKSRIEERIYTKYFPTTVMKLDRYDVDKLVYPVQVQVNEGPFEFSVYGDIEIPPQDAKVFKEKRNEGRIKLTYENKLVKIRKNLGKYCILLGLALVFKEKEFKINGDFILADDIVESGEYKRIKLDRQGRIQLEKGRKEEEVRRIHLAEREQRDRIERERLAEENREKQIALMERMAEEQQELAELAPIKKQAIAMSILVPGTGMWRVSRGKQSGLLTLLTTAGFVGGGVLCFNAYKNNYNEYHNAQTQNDMDSYYMSANNYYQAAGLLVGAGAVFWVYDIIWVATYKPGKTSLFGVNKLTAYNKVGVGLDAKSGRLNLTLCSKF